MAQGPHRLTNPYREYFNGLADKVHSARTLREPTWNSFVDKAGVARHNLPRLVIGPKTCPPRHSPGEQKFDNALAAVENIDDGVVPMSLSNEAVTLDIAFLDSVIEKLEPKTVDDFADKREYDLLQIQLGRAYWQRFMLKDKCDSEDMKSALYKYFYVNTAPAGDWNAFEKISMHCEQAAVHLTSLKQDNFQQDADIARQSLNLGVTLSSVQDDLYGLIYTNSALAEVLKSFYLNQGQIELLDEAQDVISDAIARAPDGLVQLANFLYIAGDLCILRFLHRGNLENIETALDLFEAGLNLTAQGSSTSIKLTRGLGIALRLRFEALGNVEDLLTSWIELERLMDMRGLYPWQRATCAVAFAETVLQAYILTDDLRAINRLYALYTIAQVRQNFRDPLNIQSKLIDASHCFWRYKRVGLGGLVTEGLEKLALAYTARQTRTDWEPKFSLVDLEIAAGEGFLIRFSHHGSLDDLSDAIKHFENARFLLHHGDVRLGIVFANLAFLKSTNMVLTNSLSIKGFESALELMRNSIWSSLDHSQKQRWYVLINFFESCWALSGIPDRSEKWRFQLYDLVENCLKDSSLDIESVLQLLSLKIRLLLARISGNPDATEVGQCLEQARSTVKTLCDATASRKNVVLKQGFLEFKVLITTFDVTGNRTIAQEAIDRREEFKGPFWSSLMQDITVDVECAQMATTLGLDNKFIEDLYWAASSTLHKAASESLSDSQRFSIIRRYSWIATKAALLNDITGTSSWAAIFQSLESSRSLTWADLLLREEPLDGFRKNHSNLADRIDNYRSEIEKGRLRTKSASPIMDLNRLEKFEAEFRMHLARGEIMKLPGFEGWNELYGRQTSQDFAEGPVVMILHDDNISHAILATTEGIGHMKLPLLGPDTCKNIYNCLHGGASTRDVEDALLRLWHAAGRPILENLGLMKGDTPLQRIWWITSGWLNYLPIHSAGDLDECRRGNPASVMDFVVSSYVPSLRALFNLRDKFKKMRATESDEGSLPWAHLFALKKTPHQIETLDSALDEVSGVKSVLQPLCKIAEFSDRENTPLPQCQIALKSLRTSKLVHFACHGRADGKDPLKTEILLHDCKTRHLTVQKLMHSRQPRCQLAYLSICDAAVSKDQDLRDESLHVAGALLLAGVPIAVGTLWRLNDRLAAKVAVNFYQDLVNGSDTLGASAISLERSAGSLHRVIKKIRDDGEDAISWATYAHFGV